MCVCAGVCVSNLTIVAARRQDYLRRPSQPCNNLSVSGIHLSFQTARDQVLPLSHFCLFQVLSPARAPGTAGAGALSRLASTFIFCKALHAMATKAVTSTCFPYHMTRQSLPPPPHAYSCSLQMANCIAHVYACRAPHTTIRANFSRVALHYIWFAIALHIIVHTHTLYTQYVTTYRYTLIHGYTYVYTGG